ncbi:hypothetical protein EOK75_04160 [Pseudorhodobacter turbinis]|uniref:Uncharacterized protein n=1 Tax=Pseudorhodobacter turbinis TaxID=2500533 RepID=A0A4P8EF24_9RHOB|nr:hypothetical protein [Pseudorhodobacter turbinis]QCO55045.1 hypothetical protein EOK75_04160 [Pseudorhodobacter turbinis]
MDVNNLKFLGPLVGFEIEMMKEPETSKGAADSLITNIQLAGIVVGLCSNRSEPWYMGQQNG